MKEKQKREEILPLFCTPNQAKTKGQTNKKPKERKKNIEQKFKINRLST